MTQMKEFKQMSLDQRLQCTFMPMCSNIYNGLGYMLGPDAGWDEHKLKQFDEWRKQHNVNFDSVVYEFPDLETFVMARIIFE